MKSFVIFGMGRTGSSLLVSLLNSHPQIRCEGELFRPERWRQPLRPLAAFWRRFPQPYLAYRQVRTHLLVHKTVYGFKLHTKLSADQLADMTGFLYLVDRKGWKIIHLERLSLFDQVISGLVAGQTRRYFGDNHEPRLAAQVVISADTFRTQMERANKISQNNRRILADIPHLTVTYEVDLAQETSWQATVVRICGYLDIPSTPHVESRVTKPWSRPYSKIVVNYAELLSICQEYEDQPSLPNREK